MRIERAWDQPSTHQKLARSVRCSLFPPKITVLVHAQVHAQAPWPTYRFSRHGKIEKSITTNIFLNVCIKKKFVENCAVIDFFIFPPRAHLCGLTKTTITHRFSFWAEKRYSARIALIFGGWRLGPKLFHSAQKKSNCTLGL